MRPRGSPGRWRAPSNQSNRTQGRSDTWPPAVAGAKGDRLPAVVGKRPSRRLALYRHVDRKSCLHAEHAARSLLALVALAQRYALRVGSFVGNAELSAITRRLTGGHFPSCSSGPRSWICPHGETIIRPLRTGTSSGSRVMFCSSNSATGSGRNPTGRQPR